MKTFKGKTAVVTGAAAGIGQALVVELVKRGANVAYNDIANMSETESLVEELKRSGHSGLDLSGIRSYNEKTDMGDKKAIHKFKDNVLKEMGSVDVLINNAGIALGDRTFEEVTEADYEKITNVNYWGVIYTTKAFYEHMLTRPEAAVANLSSTQGILGVPFIVPYCTTKFAVRGFTDALRAEHKVRGFNQFTVHTVHPGAVATNITLNADYHGENTGAFHELLQKRGATPTEAALAILNGILKNKPRIMISDAPLQDLLARLMPGNAPVVINAAMGLLGAKKR